jgi:hypothetical protein
MSEYLTTAELQELTGHRKPQRQAATLVDLGIPFKAAGPRIFVDRRVAEHWPQWQERRGEVRLELVR